MENGSFANIIKPNKFGPFPESLVALYISQVLKFSIIVLYSTISGAWLILVVYFYEAGFGRLGLST